MAMTGGCLCGAVRYEITGPALWTGHCYCRDCQKESGGGHVSVLGVAAEHLHVTKGEAARYSSPGRSGMEVVRCFCPSCGSALFGHPTITGDNRMVRAGSLDDPSGLTMGMAIFTSHAQPWDQPAEGLTCFPEAPPPPPGR